MELHRKSGRLAESARYWIRTSGLRFRMKRQRSTEAALSVVGRLTECVANRLWSHALRNNRPLAPDAGTGVCFLRDAQLER